MTSIQVFRVPQYKRPRAFDDYKQARAFCIRVNGQMQQRKARKGNMFYVYWIVWY